MSDFYNFVKNFFSTDECVGNTKYSSVGHTFRFNTNDAEGIFWFYEGENFTIDIHDVFIKKEIIHTSFSGLDNFYSFYSSYLVTVWRLFCTTRTRRARTGFITGRFGIFRPRPGRLGRIICQLPALRG